MVKLSLKTQPKSGFAASKVLVLCLLSLLMSLGIACQSTETSAPSAVKAELPPTAVYWNKEPLHANAYVPLPLGSIKPRGWLKRQLEIQANGLSGHLDEFWPDLKDSGWIGGTGESWERAPYFLDGLVPL